MVSVLVLAGLVVVDGLDAQRVVVRAKSRVHRCRPLPIHSQRDACQRTKRPRPGDRVNATRQAPGLAEEELGERVARQEDVASGVRRRHGPPCPRHRVEGRSGLCGGRIDRHLRIRHAGIGGVVRKAVSGKRNRLVFEKHGGGLARWEALNLEHATEPDEVARGDGGAIKIRPDRSRIRHTGDTVGFGSGDVSLADKRCQCQQGQQNKSHFDDLAP